MRGDITAEDILDLFFPRENVYWSTTPQRVASSAGRELAELIREELHVEDGITCGTEE